MRVFTSIAIVILVFNNLSAQVHDNDVLCNPWLIELFNESVGLRYIHYNETSKTVYLKTEYNNPDNIQLQIYSVDGDFLDNCWYSGNELPACDETVKLDFDESEQLWNYEQYILYPCCPETDYDILCNQWVKDSLIYYDPNYIDCEQLNIQYTLEEFSDSNGSTFLVIRREESDLAWGRYYDCEGLFLGTSESTVSGTIYDPSVLQFTNYVETIWSCTEELPECPNCPSDINEILCFDWLKVEYQNYVSIYDELIDVRYNADEEVIMISHIIFDNDGVETSFFDCEGVLLMECPIINNGVGSCNSEYSTIYNNSLVIHEPFNEFPECAVKTDDIQLNVAFSFSPNPTTGHLKCSIESEKYHDFEIKLYSVNGQLLNTESNSGFNLKYYNDISRNQNGLYLIRIEIDGELFRILKILKQ